MTYKLLDAFCGAGGCTKGYQQAGFHVTGVDNRPQPHYIGNRFIQADALDYLGNANLSRYHVIHASPPCQRFSVDTPYHLRELHPDLITPVQALLRKIGKPYIIENVPGARHIMRNPIMLCGSMFKIGVWRHRYFETNWPITIETTCNHKLPYLAFDGGGLLRSNETDYLNSMRVYWMNTREMRQAIPPAYTRLIGRRLIRYLQSQSSSQLGDK